MDITKLQKALNDEGPAPIYLLLGPETFLRGEAVRTIKEAANADVVELEPANLDPHWLVDDLRTPALFAPRRILIVEHAERFIMDAGDVLLRYLERPAATATLILTAESLDRRRKNPKALAGAAAVVECQAMKARDIPRWCIGRARTVGKRMDMTTVRLLVELAGTNLGQLDGQINNLAAYSAQRDTITYQDVEDLVGGDHAHKVWDLTDAMMKRDAPKALKTFDRLMREPGSAEFTLIPKIAGKLRDMLDVKRLSETGRTREEIRKTLGKHPYVVKLLQEAVRKLSAQELGAKYQLLLEADLDLKTLPNRERRWVAERLILRLCGLKARSGTNKSHKSAIRNPSTPTGESMSGCPRWPGL